MAGIQSAPLENDLFRFVSVRGVNYPEDGATDRRFAFSGLPSTYIDFDAKYPGPPAIPRPLLMVELPKLKNQKESEALMARTIQTFLSAGQNRMAESDFDAWYPQQLRIVELWHRDNNRDRSLTRQGFVTRVETALGEAVGNFIGKPDFGLRKTRLWENLIAQKRSGAPG